MKKLFLLCSLLVAISSVANSEDSLADRAPDYIKKYCADTWGADYDMLKFCQETQLKAVFNINLVKRNYDIPETIRRAEAGEIDIKDYPRAFAFVKCMMEWEENYKMVFMCLEYEVQSYFARHRGYNGPEKSVGSRKKTKE